VLFTDIDHHTRPPGVPLRNVGHDKIADRAATAQHHEHGAKADKLAPALHEFFIYRGRLFQRAPFQRTL